MATPSITISRRLISRSLLACFVLSVGSCSWFGKDKVEAKIACPHVAVISDADLFVRFRPNKKWNRDTILYEARITRIRSACDIPGRKKTAEKKDDKKGDENETKNTAAKPQTLLAAVTLSFVTSAAPAYKGPAVLEYFVAVTDRDANVLNKDVFKVAAPKPKDEQEADPQKNRIVNFTDEPVTLKIPLKPGQKGHDFMIFAGFQLSPEHLELNRKRRRTPAELGIQGPAETPGPKDPLH